MWSGLYVSFGVGEGDLALDSRHQGLTCGC
jgi:hypothetical protein